MNYRISIVPAAQRELRNLPGHVRAQAQDLIQGLESDPRPRRARELNGLPGVFRVWLAGRWRIVYRIEDEHQTVHVLRIRRKERIDYESLVPPEQDER